ncbi:MAG: P1 family peptidase [Chloroflexota bacterium]
MKNTSTTRARDLGIPFEGTPGPDNAITDVAGVKVGHSTLVTGQGRLQVGHGPVRTGVTVVLPRGKTYDPVFAAWYSLNGNGEMTGTIWIEESGLLEGPVAITNTHSVGVVRDAIVQWQINNTLYNPLGPGVFWALPVVAETFDGTLNDINGFHVKPAHVFEALDTAKAATDADFEVSEGNVGGGTGMICHGFKGGIGSASRVVTVDGVAYTIGVLVQANHGGRDQLTIAGVPMGFEFADIATPRETGLPAETGSIIVVVATDAPLLPHQLKRLARRVPMGLAKTGSVGAHTSGDIFIAFSTANSGVASRMGTRTLQMLSSDEMTPLFSVVIQATEEAVVNAMVAAQTLVGVDGRTAFALPHARVQAILRRHHRLYG